MRYGDSEIVCMYFLTVDYLFMVSGNETKITVGKFTNVISYKIQHFKNR